MNMLITRKLSMLELNFLLEGYRKSCVLVLMVISDVTLGNWVKVSWLCQQKDIGKSAQPQKWCTLELNLLLEGYRKSYALVLMVTSDVTLSNWIKVNQLCQ